MGWRSDCNGLVQRRHRRVFVGFWSAVQRSRTEELAVTSVYFLTGGCAPKSVRWQMNSALIIQVITAFATTFWRSSGPDGNPAPRLR